MSRETSIRSIPLILAAGVMLAALSGFPGRGTVAEDPVRSSTVCLDCHGGRDSSLAGTAHWAGSTHEGAEARVACTDCHPGDRRHWEEDPAAYPMTNPSKVGAEAQAKLCATCHQNPHQQNMIERNIHTANDVSCSGCHAVHGAKHEKLLKQAEFKLCVDCHSKVEGEFARPYRHPVPEGIIQCSECHSSLDQTARELSQNGTSVCLKCHAEMSGPFPYEHPATMDFSTQEGGCLSCHEPHGSSLPRMVNQPYASPHFQLCTQCHSVPRHFSNTMHGTSFSGTPCNDCHVDLHGSYDNRLFVNESLKAQGCFNSGCHHF